MIRALRLDRSDPLSWTLMPQVSERIRRFCEEVGSDHPAAVVVDAFQLNFASRDPKMLVLVVLEGEELVGHMLFNLTVAKWGRIVGQVLQYHVDRPLRRAELDRAVLQFQPEIFDWARQHGATEFRAQCFSADMARLLRRFGLEEQGRVMRADFDEVLARLGTLDPDAREGGLS